MVRAEMGVEKGEWSERVGARRLERGKQEQCSANAYAHLGAGLRAWLTRKVLIWRVRSSYLDRDFFHAQFFPGTWPDRAAGRLSPRGARRLSPPPCASAACVRRRRIRVADVVAIFSTASRLGTLPIRRSPCQPHALTLLSRRGVPARRWVTERQLDGTATRLGRLQSPVRSPPTPRLAATARARRPHTDAQSRPRLLRS